VICPACQQEGKVSTVTRAGVFSTAMPATSYYDEQGRPHLHDPNKHSESMRCSNGHVLKRVWTTRCASCDFGDEEVEVRIIDPITLQESKR
jgi:hypothetical protein